MTFYYILIIILVVIAIYLFAIRCDMLPKQFEWIVGRNFAHRGLYTADQTIPENSVAAFRRAADAHYGIEMDVQLSKDGQVFVFHDDDLLRMVDHRHAIAIPKLNVTEMTYDDLSSFPLGRSNERIPLLKDVLTIIKGRVPIYLEIKEFGNHYEVLCDAVINLLHSYQGNVAIASFNPYVLNYMRKKAPHLMRIQITQNLRYSNMVWWKKFFLQNLLFNCITKPHAISYQYDKINLSFRLCRFMMVYTLGWTIQNPTVFEMNQKYFDSVVFEHFQPPVRMIER